jgi:hypothetical protein
LPRRGKRRDRDKVAIAFGAAVRRARGARTLTEVAHDIPGMDPKYLGEIELGWHAPTIVTARRIAEALDISLSDLVTGL